jgi:hypothetical protein
MLMRHIILVLDRFVVFAMACVIVYLLVANGVIGRLFGLATATSAGGAAESSKAATSANASLMWELVLTNIFLVLVGGLVGVFVGVVRRPSAAKIPNLGKAPFPMVALFAPLVRITGAAVLTALLVFLCMTNAEAAPFFLTLSRGLLITFGIYIVTELVSLRFRLISPKGKGAA